MTIRRKVTMSICLPVTVELTVETDRDEGAGLEDAEWSVKSVRVPIGNAYTSRAVEEAMDEDELAELDRLACAAPDA